MTPEQVALLRADMEARHRRVRNLQRGGYVCVALHVVIGAWFASRIALGHDEPLFFVLLNGALAFVGLRWNARRWADWLALRDYFERELKRLEAEG